MIFFLLRQLVKNNMEVDVINKRRIETLEEEKIRRTGPVLLGGGGEGGGAEVSCPNMFSIACPKKQVVLLE